ncbi:hypothetical protein ONZ45_g13410 [Pleurotus djamor]|nr:hypothetical protein ONZ45_g13410 [Pleurotus djamor]
MSTVLVKSFTHLKDRPNADRALHMLQRVASLVKPIMRKHAWTLPVLSEFFPDNPSLVGLNVNGGQKILLRLRPPHNPETFYEEEQVVLVMLHELTHNVHGPHDDKFYKYLANLETEWEALKRSGYSGEGFLSEGHRLGTNISHNVPQHQARAKALEAAEKRRKVGSLMGRGGRLGGTDIKNLTPRELAARAAERRARDSKACASGADADREAEKAAQESVSSQAIDLTGDNGIIEIDDPRPLAGPSGPSKMTGPMANGRTDTDIPQMPNKELSDDIIIIDDDDVPTDSTKRHSTTAPESLSRALQQTAPKSTVGLGVIQSKNPPPPPARASNQPSEWACPTCTLLNPRSASQCDACLTSRPIDGSEGWKCRVSICPSLRYFKCRDSLLIEADVFDVKLLFYTLSQRLDFLGKVRNGEPAELTNFATVSTFLIVNAMMADLSGCDWRRRYRVAMRGGIKQGSKT